MPLRADPELRSHPIDLAHADCYTKGGLQFSLDLARRNLRMGGTKLGEPGSRWFGQLVGMAVAIIEKSQPGFVFGTRQLPEAVSGGARNVQLALGHR